MVTDGLFSADGDCARISNIVQLCTKYGAISYVDDAHEVEVIGRRGRGVIEASDISHGVDYVVGTMSKFFNSTGGFLALSAEGKKDLKFRVSSYTSSQSVSPRVATASCGSIQIVDKECDSMLIKVHELSKALRWGLRNNGFCVLGDSSPIISIDFKCDIDALEYAQHLLSSKIMVAVFLHPAVLKNSPRVRVGMAPFITMSDVDDFIDESVQYASKKLREISITNKQPLTAKLR